MFGGALSIQKKYRFFLDGVSQTKKLEESPNLIKNRDNYDFSWFFMVFGACQPSLNFHIYFLEQIRLFPIFWYQIFENLIKIELWGVYRVKYSRSKKFKIENFILPILNFLDLEYLTLKTPQSSILVRFSNIWYQNAWKSIIYYKKIYKK